MTSSIAPTAGIDISKDHLDVALYPKGESRRFTNNQSGHRALIAWLQPKRLKRVLIEATGPYHCALERRLHKAALPCVQVNPRQARRFAEATGQLAKTDRVDAAMLARFAALLEPQLRPLRNQSIEHLAELSAARRALVKDRTRTKNRAKILSLALLKRQAAQRLTHIARQIDAVDRQMRAIIAANPELQSRLDTLTSIPGLGETTAIVLIADMPELGLLDHKQAASLAGLAPVTRQSGKWRGKSSIRGGRANLRQALYMPALIAARCNPQLKAKFNALIAAGKPPKVAITAVMRKLLILANALLRDNRTWAETLP